MMRGWEWTKGMDWPVTIGKIIGTCASWVFLGALLHLGWNLVK